MTIDHNMSLHDLEVMTMCASPHIVGNGASEKILDLVEAQLDRMDQFDAVPRGLQSFVADCRVDYAMAWNMGAGRLAWAR